MEKTVGIREVKTFETRSGNTRFVLVDEDGGEYTTFRPEIGKRAQAVAGGRARIEFHEQEKGGFRNVYLDAVEPAEGERGEAGGAEQADEVAWRTAIDAAPWLLGGTASEGEVPPNELFDKLKPFKDLVEEDIEENADAEGGSER